MKMEVIVWVTIVVVIVVMGLSLYHTVKEKDATEEKNKELEEKLASTSKEIELVNEISTQTIEKIEVIQEESNACKIEVERDSIADTSGWYSQPIPSSVRDVLIECTCDANASSDNKM